MRILKFLGVLAIAAVFAGQGLQSDHVQYGGASAVDCDVSPILTACQGSYGGSIGCTTKSVTTDSWSGNETKKAAQTSVGACTGFVDTLNVACAGPANIDILPQLACRVDNPYAPW